MPTHVLDYLERQQRCAPERVAFADAKSSMTYAQLSQAAHNIGSFVARRAQPCRPIAVLAEKSCNVVAAFLGIAAAGCYYALLDPKHPVERLNMMLETLSPALILWEGISGERVARQLAAAELPLAPLAEACLEPENAALLAARRSGAIDTDPLYAMFTSGSTGRPKGVLVSHRSVVDFIEHFASIFGFSDADVIGNQAPFDFDVSTKDIYTGLKCGARVELLEKKLFSFPVQLIQRLEERGVTALIWAVSALVIVSTVDALAQICPGKLNKILFSGETMPVRHLEYWRAHYPHARFVNLYGPTEITCNCTYYEIQPGETFSEESALPIGKPFPNERVFLLGEGGEEIAEPGSVGELCVTGSCLALGYVNDPERTRAVFCQNPLNTAWPQTVYRTGDLACYGEDGLLYFRARKDFQIKHMGHRIELQEIELYVQAGAGVERCCCVFFKEQQQVVAFYEGSAEAAGIVSALRSKLPAYMIPQRFERLEHLPINANGKIDRARLARGGIEKI